MSKTKKYENYLDQKSPEKYPWAWAIILRRNLESDCYEGFTLELLGMLALKAEKLAHIIHKDAAVTPKTRQAIRDVGYMLDEALLMAKLSPKVATDGLRLVEVSPEELAKLDPAEIEWRTSYVKPNEKNKPTK